MKINTILMSAGKRYRLGLCLIFCLFFYQGNNAALAQEGNFSHRSPIPKFKLQVSHQDSLLVPPQQPFQKAPILDQSKSIPWVDSSRSGNLQSNNQNQKAESQTQQTSMMQQPPRQLAMQENMPRQERMQQPMMQLPSTMQQPMQQASMQQPLSLQQPLQGRSVMQQRTELPLSQMIPPPPAAEDRPNSYMEEYQVSWSPWIQNLANRWHRILRDSEDLLGVEFQTSRPALIQFTCYADGRIGNVVLRQSSGIPVYDKMQILSLMEASPLEPFPPGTQKRTVTLIQGWESHKRQPGEQEFNTRAFANRYPQEKVSRWVSQQ